MGASTATKGVRLTSLPRTQRASSTQLLLRILDRPELVAALRELPAPVLGRLIDRVGLEDAGELVALASSEQLQGVFDQGGVTAGGSGHRAHRGVGEGDEFRGLAHAGTCSRTPARLILAAASIRTGTIFPIRRSGPSQWTA